MLRALAIAAQGASCHVCGFSFTAAYGPLGDGYAEVHHLTRLSTLRVAVPVDPSSDVIVLYANWHRMAHRRDRPFRRRS